MTLVVSGGAAESGAMTVDAGIYTWTQAPVPPGFEPSNTGAGSNIDCTDRDGGPFEERSTVSGTTVNINVQPGETVTCTWRYHQAPSARGEE